jgi:hypothetical protein
LVPAKAEDLFVQMGKHFMLLCKMLTAADKMLLRLEIFTAVKMWIVVFWVACHVVLQMVTNVLKEHIASIFCPADGGDTFL